MTPVQQDAAAPGSPPQATPDSLWLEGLKLLRPFIPEGDLRKLVVLVEPRVAEEWQPLAVEWTMRPGKQLTVWFHPDILDRWHRIEQCEVALFAACITQLWLSQELMWNRRNMTDAQLDLCKLAGCACTDSSHPSERWRQLYVQGVDPQGVVEATDGFPTHCIICLRPVNSDEPRSDCHAGCVVYAKSVLVPQLKAARKAEKAAATRELDR